MVSTFDYDAAFARNLGWVTEEEQKTLRQKRIAIAGMGGVGGVHLTTLARLGIGAFNISDFDTFDLVNFNRQAGATMAALGRPKVDVLAEMALEINPELKIERFPEGVSDANLDRFLDGVDLYVDGLDFFCFEARRATFAACRRKGVPAITAAPLGLGVAFLAFMPDSMSFEDYFGLEGCDEWEMAIRFLLGLSPAMLQRSYLADQSRVNLAEHRGPSTVAACQLCAGVTATEALKILLGRGMLRPAPWGYQFDAYRNRLVRTWRPGGNRNPIQRLALLIARGQLRRMQGGGERRG
ncbi:ThiF family adenylyltransferase [Azoarcus sp. KH32C]|uniref:ThiF family adenylyltransferase n=1 Tax=Azoarcus sp. KH32C TaxID=748247 RepID=UPI0002386FB2|nr:ThiF family adenylyltransferase [Azoarcus sp. KH32C]BAL23415.1 molybdopterin biosynthesis protein [Azoarcus sp. KH32C]